MSGRSIETAEVEYAGDFFRSKFVRQKGEWIRKTEVLRRTYCDMHCDIAQQLRIDYVGLYNLPDMYITPEPADV